MAFVTEEMVEAELSYLITTSTQPTTAEVLTFITQIEAAVKGILHSLKINPDSITLAGTPDAYNNVSMWALWGVCSRVIAAAGGLIRAQPQKEQNYWDRFQQFAENLKEDPNSLANDVPFYASDSNMVWPAGITDSHDDYYSPEFTMDEEW